MDLLNKTGVYCLSWKNVDPKDKIYIGSGAISLMNRKRKHEIKFKEGNNSKKLQKQYDKFGFPEFKILSIVPQSKCIETEQYWIDILNPELNHSTRAYHSLGFKHSEETKRYISELNKSMSQETKDKIANTLKGKKLSEEHKANISKGLKGKPGHKHTEETKIKIGLSGKGRKHTEKRKKDQSFSMKKRWADPEYKAKLLAKYKERYQDPEQRKKQSRIGLKRYQDPEERAKTSDATKKWWAENREEINRKRAATRLRNKQKGVLI